MKLCDDMFNLFQYIEGDNGIDITRMFTEKSKSRIKQHVTVVQGPIRDQPKSSVNDSGTAMNDFCMELLQEMRADRDLIRTDLQEVKKNTAVIQSVKKDVENLRTLWHEDMMKMESRITAIETKWAQTDRGMRDIGRRNSQGNVADDIQKNQEWTVRETQTIRQICADSSERMNRMELSMTKIQGSVATIDEHSYKIAMIQARVDSLSSESQHEDRRVKGHIAPRSDQPSSSSATTYALATFSSGGATSRQTESNTGTKFKPVANKVVTTVDDTLTVTVNNKDKSPKSSDNGELAGFIPVKGKARNTPIFVSGIMMKDGDIDETVKSVYTYIAKRGCNAKSVRKIKENGTTASVKIVLSQSESDKLLNDGFWPHGIYCRLWID